MQHITNLTDEYEVHISAVTYGLIMDHLSAGADVSKIRHFGREVSNNYNYNGTASQ